MRLLLILGSLARQRFHPTLLPYLRLSFWICSQQKTDPRVAVLSSKIIPLINDIDNTDSCKKALVYLDSATAIYNHCFQCYYNKLMLLYSLKRYDKALETINECIRIKPQAHDLYTIGGVLNEKIGDRASSGKYFQKSLTILNPLLDTMKVQNINYEMLVITKAINLIMLGDDKAGNNLLKASADRQQEPELKETTLSFMNKSKEQLVDMITDSQYIQ